MASSEGESTVFTEQIDFFNYYFQDIVELLDEDEERRPQVGLRLRREGEAARERAQKARRQLQRVAEALVQHRPVPSERHAARTRSRPGRRAVVADDAAAAQPP